MSGVPSPVSLPKKASWVEVYFDLVFVLAVARVAHIVAAGHGWSAIVTALGVFLVLWWTWIGFVLFYNRYGDEKSQLQRVLLILGTIPCGVAAVAVDELAHGERLVFALSMAAVRLLLAVAHHIRPGRLPSRIAAGYLLSAAGFAVSALLDGPWWALMWVAMLGAEAVNLFAANRKHRKLSQQEADELSEEENWRKAVEFFKPTDAEYALQSNHLAERFGLFMIILLGEVVASSGSGVLDGAGVSWMALIGAIGISGALWWIYFDSAHVIAERIIVVAGGSPEVARSTYALGQVAPAFGLIMTAGGLRQLLDGEADSLAYWFTSIGLGLYMAFMRVDLRISRGFWIRLAGILATVPLALLHTFVSPQAFIWVIFAWAVLNAYSLSVGGREARALLEAPAPEPQDDPPQADPAQDDPAEPRTVAIT